MNELKEIREHYEGGYYHTNKWFAHVGKLLRIVDEFAGHRDAAEIDLESVKAQLEAIINSPDIDEYPPLIEARKQLEALLPKWTKITDDEDTWPPTR